MTVENASLREAAENASKLAATEREGRATDAKALAAAAARHAKAEKEARSQADAAEGEARAKDAKHAAIIKVRNIVDGTFVRFYNCFLLLTGIEERNNSLEEEV